MQSLDLAENIYRVRNTGQPSQVLVAADGLTKGGKRPVGVLLLKPSSGQIPLPTVREILRRLTDQHEYSIRSVVWWSGPDVRTQELMSKHYPGFHRVAHGGWDALSGVARARLESLYDQADASTSLAGALGAAFERSLVQTPYALVREGMTADIINDIWERNRSSETNPLRTIQRLDEDSFALALRLSGEPGVPPGLRGKTVILLNGFYAKLEHDFEARGCVAIWIEQGETSSTSWEDLRNRYAGKTNPFQAPPETIRGDAARGVLPVEKVSILANVIHLSANEVEGRREVEEVWWEPSCFAAVFSKPS